MASEQEPEGFVAAVLGRTVSTESGLDLVVTHASIREGRRIDGSSVPISAVVLAVRSRVDVHVICTWSPLNDIVKFRSAVHADSDLPVQWMLVSRRIDSLDDLAACLHLDSVGSVFEAGDGKNYTNPEAWMRSAMQQPTYQTYGG